MCYIVNLFRFPFVLLAHKNSIAYKCGKRNPEMRKFKYFNDEEFEIIDCKRDRGVAKEHFVWIVKSINKNNNESVSFSAKPKGTREEKEEWYDNHKDYIGRVLTIKFQGYSEDGIPRFPIAKGFRENKGVD